MIGQIPHKERIKRAFFQNTQFERDERRHASKEIFELEKEKYDEEYSDPSNGRR